MHYTTSIIISLFRHTNNFVNKFFITINFRSNVNNIILKTNIQNRIGMVITKILSISCSVKITDICIKIFDDIVGQNHTRCFAPFPKAINFKTFWIIIPTTLHTRIICSINKLIIQVRRPMRKNIRINNIPIFTLYPMQSGYRIKCHCNLIV